MSEVKSKLEGTRVNTQQNMSEKEVAKKANVKKSKISCNYTHNCQNLEASEASLSKWDGQINCGRSRQWNIT